MLAELALVGVARSQVRILSAHYGAGEHICSPSQCGASFVADGTQYRDDFPGLGGSRIDMSVLADGFFGTPAAPVPAAYTWTEFDMAKLPVLRQGAADHPGAFFYVRRLQQLVLLTGTLNALPAASVAVDGVYGPKTAAGVRAVQAHYRITQDGIAGPQVWGVLLTGGA